MYVLVHQVDVQLYFVLLRLLVLLLGVVATRPSFLISLMRVEQICWCVLSETSTEEEEGDLHI